MIAYIGIGSNIRPQENLPRALDLLRQALDVRRVSPIYESPAWSRPAQPPFWNAVAQLHTALDVNALCSELKRIEHALGRVRSADKHAARTIDLDLVAAPDYADPALESRPFLAVPLLDVDPAYHLPSGQALRELVQRMQPDQLKRVIASTPRPSPEG